MEYSHWEDLRDLAYAEYVDQYNFDAPEGMELMVFERLKAVDEPVMMVGEVTSPGHVCQKLLSDSLSEADMVSTEPVADILTVGHDVPRIAESPICRNSCETDGGGVAFYYEGDLSDSDCGSVGDRAIDTWEDWCDSAFRNGYGGFPPDTDDPQPSSVTSSVTGCFGMRTLPSHHEGCRTVGMCLHRQLQAFADTVKTLVPPDTGWIVRFDNNELEFMDIRIGEFSVPSLGVCDPSIDMDTLDGDELGIGSRDVGISDGDEEWLCLLYSARSWSVWGNSVAAGLDCQGLDHWRGIVWDPGIVGKCCLHVCLCLIALFLGCDDIGS